MTSSITGWRISLFIVFLVLWQLELSKMKTGMYNLRMFYQQQPGIFMHMTQAIESLDLNILNSHVSTCDGYVVHSMIAKVCTGA